VTESGEPRSIAEKLDALFRTVHPGGQGEYSHAAVAEAIREQQGVPISHTYIWQLRTGRRTNPTIQHLTALAAFFGVPVAYFLDEPDGARVEQDLELLTAMKQAGVTEIALRAARLSPGSRSTVKDMLDQIWRLEHPDEKPSD
jgi:transcriptional regulator with XRE-family HTH domain